MESKTKTRLSNSLQEDCTSQNVATGKGNGANGDDNVANDKENVANGKDNVAYDKENVANGKGNVAFDKENVDNSNENVDNGNENEVNGEENVANGNAANERSLSLGEDFEMISDDEYDINKETINQIKKDLDALVKDKRKVTKEKEDLAESLRVREQKVLELQQQVDWFIELNTSFINKNDALPAVPTGCTEVAQKRLISIHEGMEHTLKDLRSCQEKDANGDLDDDVEVIQLPSVDEGQEITAELEFYRSINKMLTAELEEQNNQGLEFPEVPSSVPEQVQNDLQRHKTMIKNILQKHTSTARVAEEPSYDRDSISTSFTNVEIKTNIKLDERNEPTVVKGKPELHSKCPQSEERAKTEIQSKHTQTDVSSTELEKLFEENNALMHVTANQKKIIEEKEQKVWELENKLKIETAEKENALSRISKLAGAKLIEDNPCISDLSDDYRPLKIAEMFNELYDNEWTDALSALMYGMEKSEEVAVQNLLEILQEISVLCQFGAVQQQSDVFNALIVKNTNVSETTEMTTQKPSKQELRKVKEFQKKMATSFLPSLEQSILEDQTFRGTFRKEAQLCQPYIRKCIQLCWMMNVHDPAMELVFEFYPGQDMDEKLIKPYKKKGSKINYLVWPVLLLHHEGPVAQKGVAQPI